MFCLLFCFDLTTGTCNSSRKGYYENPSSLTPGQMKYRHISCLCKRKECVLDCPCFKLHVVPLADFPLSSDQSPACGKTPDHMRRPEMIELKHIGEWCIVNYDNEAYPGVIMDVEGHSVKVKCMHRNGVNKFF